MAAEVEGPAVVEDGAAVLVEDGAAAAEEEGRQDLCRGIPLKGQASAHHLRHYQSLRSSRRRAGSSGLTPRRLIHVGALVLLAPVLYQVMVATVRAAAGAVVAGAVVAGYVFLASRNITCFIFNSTCMPAPSYILSGSSSHPLALDHVTFLQSQPKSRSDSRNSTESPAPQNLRGDPFRKSKIKTELCRNFMQSGICQYADKCNYAHGKDDLKFQTLLELDNGGVTDVEIYRTRVCFTWVATGSW